MSSGEYRVKVYLFDEATEQWEDAGTGLLSLEMNENIDGLCITVKDEASIHTIFETKAISSEDNQDIYTKDGDKIIAWRDPMLDDKQCALSFEDANEANIIYHRLTLTTPKALSNKLPLAYSIASLKTDTRKRIFSFLQETLILTSYSEAELMELIKLIKSLFANKTPLLEYKISLHLLLDKDLLNNTPKQCIFRKLFHLINDRKSNRNLFKSLYGLLRCIIDSSEPILFEFLVRDDIFKIICSLYDCDFENIGYKCKNHYELYEKSKFVNLLNINSDKILAKIEEKQRVKYFKNILLNRILEEIPYNLMNNLEILNFNEILHMLKIDNKFMTNIYQLILKDNEDSLRLLEVILSNLKNLKEIEIVIFNQSHEIYKVLETMLKRDINQNQVCVIGKILKLSMEHDLVTVYSVLVKQIDHYLIYKNADCLIIQLITIFTTTSDDNAVYLYFELFQLLFSQNDTPMFNQFMTKFYNNLGKQLFQPLLEETSEFVKISLLTKLLTCSLYIDCFAVKCFIVTNNVLDHLMNQLDVKNNNYAIHIACIKLLKSLVLSKERMFYSDYIKKTKVFSIFFDYFKCIGQNKQYSLIYSICLNLLYEVVLTKNKILLNFFNDSPDIKSFILSIHEGGINRLFKETVLAKNQLPNVQKKRKFKVCSEEIKTVT